MNLCTSICKYNSRRVTNVTIESDNDADKATCGKANTKTAHERIVRGNAITATRFDPSCTWIGDNECNRTKLRNDVSSNIITHRSATYRAKRLFDRLVACNKIVL